MKRLAWGSVLVAVTGAILLLVWPSGPRAPRIDPAPAAVAPPEPAPFRPATAAPSPIPAAPGAGLAPAEPSSAQREAFAAGVERRIGEHRSAAGQRRSERAERREARRLERLEQVKARRERRGERPRPEHSYVVPVEATDEAEPQ